MQRFTATAWLLAMSSLAGCARSTDGRLGVWWPFATPTSTSALAAAPATEQAAPAVNENGQPAGAAVGQVGAERSPTPLASGPTTLSAASPDGAGPNGTTIESLVEQLRASGALDPAAEAQLRADLSHTDPALWPLVAQQLRATAAYRRQAEGAPARHEHSARQVAAVGFPQPEVMQPVTSPESTPRAEAASAEVLSGEDVFAEEPPPPMAFASDGSSGEIPAQAALLPPEQRMPSLGEQGPPRVSAAQSPVGVQQVQVYSQPAVPERVPAPIGMPQPGEFAPGSDASAGLALSQVPGSLQQQPAVMIPLPAAAAPQQPAPGAPLPNSLPFASAGPSELPANAGAAVQAAYVSEPVVGAIAESLDPLAQAIAELEKQTQGPARNAEEIRAHAALRLLYLSAGRRDDALKPIPGLPAGQQDFWLEEMYGLSTLLDSQQISDPAKRAVEARRHLDRALLRLADSAELLVYNLVFCTEVTSFGVYEETAKTEFRAGEEVLLYAEVENFRSEETEDGFHTALRSSYQIFDSQGRRVTSQDFNVMEEHCQNPRRDFFVRYFLEMPERIYPGDYTLELTIEDSLSQKLGSGRIQFTIVE